MDLRYIHGLQQRAHQHQVRRRSNEALTTATSSAFTCRCCAKARATRRPTTSSTRSTLRKMKPHGVPGEYLARTGDRRRRAGKGAEERSGSPGAALDVFEKEPLPADSPLRDPEIEDRCRLLSALRQCRHVSRACTSIPTGHGRTLRAGTDRCAGAELRRRREQDAVRGEQGSVPVGRSYRLSAIGYQFAAIRSQLSAICPSASSSTIVNCHPERRCAVLGHRSRRICCLPAVEKHSAAGKQQIPRLRSYAAPLGMTIQEG